MHERRHCLRDEWYLYLKLTWLNNRDEIISHLTQNESVTIIINELPRIHVIVILVWFLKGRAFLLHCTRYDHDSGHDSGSEDTCYDLSQPFTLLTLGMGKLFIPKASSSSSVSTATAPPPSDPSSRVLPMPQRLGVCLDYDACRVYFYDADTMRCLYERQVDCSGTMYPAFGLMGSGKVQLEEFITAKRLTFWGGMECVDAWRPASA